MKNEIEFDNRGYSYLDAGILTEAGPYHVEGDCEAFNFVVDLRTGNAEITSINKDFKEDMHIPTYVTGFPLYLPDNCSNLFKECKMKSLTFNILNTSNITNMNSMFNRCSALEELDLSNFDTSNVTDMFGMFSWCMSLKDLDVNCFHTSSVKDMSFMFLRCDSLKEIDLSTFDTSSVESMDWMFNEKVKATVYTSDNKIIEYCNNHNIQID